MVPRAFVAFGIGTLCALSASAGILRFDSSPLTPRTNITLRHDGDRVVIVDDDSHAILTSARADATDGVVIRGVDGDHDDTLTIDMRGLILPGSIDFDGGRGGFDTLRVIAASGYAV